MKPCRSQWARKSAVLAVLASAFGFGRAGAQSFLPPVLIDENANFMKTIAGGPSAAFGILLICEGEPVPKADIPTILNPNTGQLEFPGDAWKSLCGNTLPNFGISDIVAFLPGAPSGIFIQMASDADADGAPADVTPIPGVFKNTNITAITEVEGPSGFIEYAPNVNQPGFFTSADGTQTSLYEIQSDCLPTSEHFAQCGVPNQIAPQCGDPGGACGELTGQTFGAPEPSTWSLLLTGLFVIAAVFRTKRSSNFARGPRDVNVHVVVNCSP